ncbi:LysR family transcriptional regulator [Phenylobacterium immobile]|uniref:LysR family transcriptional regulator n=1 Tax=Phenylobacterium immobile TaxID=21 RepID=UPI000B07CFBA|nr:LysR family transcriptional regulator [Phenylobacterium immobile]
MPGRDLLELEMVLAVARLGGFTAAASALGVSTSAVSHAVAAMEARLGVRLFNRTTRSVALSQAGQEFVAQVAPATAAIREAMAAAGRHAETPTGTLRLNATPMGAQHLLSRYVLAYRRLYPDVAVDLVIDAHAIDIVTEGFDAGVRLADAVPPDMIAVPITHDLRHIVVAAPAYLAEFGTPQTPDDLAAHQCIRIRRTSGALYRWEFERDGRQTQIDVPGALTLNSSELMIAAALAGAGLAYVSASSVEAALASGALVTVLSDWTPPYPGLRLYYPGRRHLPARLRRFIDIVREGHPAAGPTSP